MPPETEHAIDKGNVYRDDHAEQVGYVTIDGFYVDEAGVTQVKVRLYTDKPIAAHNSCMTTDGVHGKLTLTVNDVRDRILKGELVFDGKE